MLSALAGSIVYLRGIFLNTLLAFFAGEQPSAIYSTGCGVHLFPPVMKFIRINMRWFEDRPLCWLHRRKENTSEERPWHSCCDFFTKAKQNYTNDYAMIRRLTLMLASSQKRKYEWRKTVAQLLRLLYESKTKLYEWLCVDLKTDPYVGFIAEKKIRVKKDRGTVAATSSMPSLTSRVVKISISIALPWGAPKLGTWRVSRFRKRIKIFPVLFPLYTKQSVLAHAFVQGSVLWGALQQRQQRM